MEIVLFDNKVNCCACGACMNICPKGAITMIEDEYGFLYPEINKELCIKCGACKKVCAYQNISPTKRPLKAFAAVNKNKEQLMKSASGGVFSALATNVLNKGGVVFGATLTFENGHAIPKHIAIDQVEQLSLLQGSKYVQSSIGDTYKQAKIYLQEGRLVLFSGTPCQIGGLYGYLGKDYESLISIDVICHGVPNAKMFDDYLQNERIKRKAQSVVGYSFRDKKKGWGMNGRLDLRFKDNKVKSFYIPARLASYNTLFLDGDTYRENCYSCKYAGELRPADLTIGDYWGIEVEHPELLKKEEYKEEFGISCVLANTSKGIAICEELNNLTFDESTFEKVSHRNGQLRFPSKRTERRQTILSIYSKYGYPKLERWFFDNYKKQMIIHATYNAIPRNLRIKLKTLLKK